MAAVGRVRVVCVVRVEEVLTLVGEEPAWVLAVVWWEICARIGRAVLEAGGVEALDAPGPPTHTAAICVSGTLSIRTLDSSNDSRGPWRFRTRSIVFARDRLHHSQTRTVFSTELDAVSSRKVSRLFEDVEAGAVDERVGIAAVDTVGAVLRWRDLARRVAHLEAALFHET